VQGKREGRAATGYALAYEERPTGRLGLGSRRSG